MIDEKVFYLIVFLIELIVSYHIDHHESNVELNWFELLFYKVLLLIHFNRKQRVVEAEKRLVLDGE
jgi:hypothetical protein